MTTVEALNVTLYFKLDGGLMGHQGAVLKAAVQYFKDNTTGYEVGGNCFWREYQVSLTRYEEITGLELVQISQEELDRLSSLMKSFIEECNTKQDVVKATFLRVE